MTAGPISEYLRVLYKINELYSKYFTGKEDLLDEINYYSSKKNVYKKDIKNIEKKCKTEWKKILNLFCNSLLEKLESKQKYKELFKIELKDIKNISIKIKNEDLSIDQYEKIFDEDFTDLNDKMGVEIFKEKIDTNRFWYGLIVGLVIGVIGIVLTLLYL